MKKIKKIKITVFTSNQARHLALIELLATIADEVYAVQECNTIFPGEIKDFYDNSEIMQKYFRRVIDAEKKVFGNPGFVSPNVRQFAIKSGDLKQLDIKSLDLALHSDVYVIFGSGFIKGDLCDFLVEKKALNIHMGTSPYYRGSGCNFWALHDGKPEYVGATIHLLSKGLDSGPMLFHALPKAGTADPFLLGMLAVKAAHLGLIYYLETGEIWYMVPATQDKTLEIRYSRNKDFTDEIASEYLKNPPTPKIIYSALKKRDSKLFIRPIFY